VARLLAFLLGVAGAVTASQGPGFTLQYMQNLQGRIDELRPLVEQYDADLAGYGYNRAMASAECETATTLLNVLCDGYERTVVRYERLTAHLEELEAADAYVRPLLLVRNRMDDVAQSTYSRFEPAVPTTLVGGIYAGGGFAFFWGASTFLFGLLGGRR